MPNENFRRELGHVFDEIAGSPSGALGDRVRSSLADVPERKGPFWIAGLAAALIAAIVVSLLVVANLNRNPTGLVPGGVATPSPSASPTPASNLPAFTCDSFTSYVALATVPASPPVAFIDAVRPGTHAGYDRITIEFNNAIPKQGDVATQSNATFIEGASGQSVKLAGSAGILVTLHGADAHTAYIGPIDFKTGYLVLLEARQMQDFEGTVQWGFGLAKPACYRTFSLTNPARLVIDIQTP